MSQSIFWVPTPLTTRIEVSGPSHVRFLQGLCSNDVSKLETGQACEAFIPTVQGKILAHGYLLKYDDRIVFIGLGNQTEALLSHLQKYAMIEDVDVVDLAEKTSAILLWGEGTQEWLSEKLGSHPWPEPLGISSLSDDGEPIEIFGTSLLGCPSYEIVGTDVASLVEGIDASPEQFETARIANRFPQHGVDFDANHLAQEVNRDDQAISFKKGCYLGQETVARIDAMGHVNKKVVPVRMSLPTEAPQLPASIVVEDKEVGQITSLAQIDGQWLGLAMIRRGLNSPGSKLVCDLGTIEVLA